ncbi:alpha/beta hydrolase family protein [Halopolyspora algeriensis]|uniref:Alpha/beta hydrolase family protein n=1 Tax=Halopolyspora algeriensis TaxID=1500506 RepID=A0A368VKW4_9ACTN|nr:alpha/beta fold hydrolase [Halopolyspora algeriensis]RCW40954.1 alpha/beta hydrolase family protein [Halopolyspora algeriensis]TQM53962.1 alpha/beta hydrolase family protein [Halopolyspora algeriensis]
MSTFVLLHGAWHGGWAWQRVVPLLREAGHEVYAPTLTGVSDRAHLLTPSVGLSTHVQDVVALVESYDLHDVVLVGHSYAGQVVTGVADRIPERVSKRVHLDAFVGDDGDAAIDLLPSTVAGHYRDSVSGPGFGWLIPVRSLTKLGVSEQADLEWLEPRLTPHPWLTYTEPLRLAGALETVPAAFVECTDWMRVFQPQAEKAAARGWPVHHIPTGHEAMVTAPKELAEVLLEVQAA